MPKPPLTRSPQNPWPEFPRVLKVDYAQQEAIARFGSDPRQYLTQTREILRDEHGVCAVQTEEVRWDKGPDGRMTLQVQPGTSKRWPADLVLIAMGFTGPEETLIQAYGLTQEARGRVVADNFMTVRRGVFAAADMHIGQSLVVRSHQRGAARRERVPCLPVRAIEALSSPDCSKWRLERCACIQIMRATLADCRFAP